MSRLNLLALVAAVTAIFVTYEGYLQSSNVGANSKSRLQRRAPIPSSPSPLSPNAVINCQENWQKNSCSNVIDATCRPCDPANPQRFKTEIALPDSVSPEVTWCADPLNGYLIPGTINANFKCTCEDAIGEPHELASLRLCCFDADSCADLIWTVSADTVLPD